MNFTNEPQQPSGSLREAERAQYPPDGDRSLSPWSGEKRGSTGESPRETALTSGSKARVEFPAPGSSFVRTLRSVA